MTPKRDHAADGAERMVTAQGEEAALRRERDLLAAVLDTAGSLIVLLDPQGRIVRFNRACETTTGYSFAEVRGQVLWELLLLPEEVAPVREVFEHLRAGQFPNQHENHWLTKAGDRRLIAWSNTALLDAHGAVEYVIGTGIDMTEHRQYSSAQQQLVELQRAQQALEQRLALEQLVTRISTEFVTLGPLDIDAGICHALQTIGEFAGVDRSYVFQFSGDGTQLDNTHEWCAPGVPSFIASLKGMPRAAFPWFLEELERLETVVVPRVGEMPAEAVSERTECQREGIRSILLEPLAYRGALVGFLGFDAVQTERSWGDDTIALLKMAAGIITNALEHRRAQAIQAGQRQFLELLAIGEDFRATLHTLVDLIEHQWPGMLGLVLLLDEDGKHLHIGASVSLPQDYVQSIEGLEIGPMVGSCGTACYRRERVIVEDTATDPRWEGLRDLALHHGLRACWSEPVLDPGGRVLGTFAMYYRQPRAPTQAELRAIEMGAHLVGVAIQHERAERALRESEGKFRTIVEYANMGIAIVQRARFRLMNPHFAAMLGYTAEEMLGKEFMPYCAPQERERIVDYYTRRARGEPVPARYTTVMLHKSGSYVYVEVSAGIIPYDGQQATFVFLRDSTEEKRAKQALEEAYRTLEQRVEERTKELAALNSIAAVVSGSLDLKEILGAALDKIREALGLEFGTAYALEGADEALPAPAENPHSPALAGQEAVAQVMQASAPAGDTGGGARLALLAHRGVSDEYAGFVGDVRPGGGAAALARLGKPFVWLVDETVPADSDLKRLLERERCCQVVTLPLIAKGKLVGALNLGTHTPRTFTPEQLALLGAIGQQIGMAVENARLYQEEQSRREEAERRRRVAEGMREVLAVLNSRQSLQETLDFISKQVCRLLGCGAGAIWRLQDDVLHIQAACGLRAEYVANMTLRRGIGGAGRALAERRPTIIANLADEKLSGVSSGPFELLLEDYRSVLSVPLVIQDKDYGAMSLYYTAPREFSGEDLDLARSATYQVALAIETARLREQAAQAAVMEERGRLARELHDSVTQSLYSVTMYTEAAARLVASGKGGADEYLRDARDTAQEALREMRLLIYQLRPPALEKGGLADALQLRLDSVERRGGVRAELMVEGEDRLPAAIQAELHQVAQEALNNTLKHAHARAVRVHLHFGDDVTRLEVEDDGTGFDLSAAQGGGGLGLASMRERAQKLGGRLEVQSAPEHGTRVVVEIPNGGGE